MTTSASRCTNLAIVLGIATGYAACSEPTELTDDRAPIGVQTSDETAGRGDVPSAEHEQERSPHPPSEQHQAPGPSLEPDPPSIEPSSAPTPVATTSCDVPDTFIEAPTDCGDLLETDRIALPQLATYPVPRVVARQLAAVDDTLYYSVRTTVPCTGSGGGGRCIPDPSGIYRKTGEGDWERIVEEFTRVFAADYSHLYWARTPQETEWPPAAIHRVPRDAVVSFVAASSQRDEYYNSLVITPRWLFSRTRIGDRAVILERRSQTSAGLDQPERLLYFENGIGILKANGQRLIWTEPDPMMLVVANLDGGHQHAATLPRDTTRRRPELTNDFAFVMLERDYGSDSDHGRSYSVCALDLQTGIAKILVPPRSRTTIREIAASSTHLFWVQTVRAPADSGAYQLWTQPLDGTPARALACVDRPIGALYTDQGYLYWVENSVFDELHRVSIATL